MYKALTIAGSDSGGGAGIQADLKTFQELGVYGASVITALTAQNTAGVQAVQVTAPDFIDAQLESVLSDLKFDAIKIGMLGNVETIEVVAGALNRFDVPKIILDPVMVAKGGASLLLEDATAALIEKIIPLSFVITPNLDEAQVIVGRELITDEDIKNAAKEIQNMGAKNVVIKGGHRIVGGIARDYLLTENGSEHYFESPKFDTPHTHGTGCTFSAAIAASLAQGSSTVEAVQLAKDFITAAISNPVGFGTKNGPTNHFAYGGRHVRP
ncbi:MAG: bifunctional hydroxymethylpyrimidine kinase/phosphomethylpyrimidine kinase [Lactobacillales bacterium]|jgi:hydroxymethylpyrimidine/phosphomethylpyrimidine kinase|nr:bifunctional hydroxymethylpyrimidine kinase/phosphomethylpyrimidine kinase [Lactobacillales bacterium]